MSEPNNDMQYLNYRYGSNFRKLSPQSPTEISESLAIRFAPAALEAWILCSGLVEIPTFRSIT